ncbi:hypothetical protein BaRGS_00001241 [Batillaria attramentaria]|uniref:Cadherin domain-containing protein n=1 Tax=Batillaria attramentaria TaxID=370345 RepID=A0ABD0M789_9CAEN
MAASMGADDNLPNRFLHMFVSNNSRTRKACSSNTQYLKLARKGCVDLCYARIGEWPAVGPLMAKMLWLALLGVLVFCSGVAEGQNKPRFIDVSILDGRQYSEALRPGRVLGTIRAVDPDGGPITYSLAGEAAQYLEISEDTGVVRIKVQFDYELDSRLTVIIIATKSDGSSERYVTNIDILDANDLPPKFSETLYRYDLPEDTEVGHVLTSLLVYDNDTENRQISVVCDSATTLLRRACEVFGVTPTFLSNRRWTGNLVLLQPLDYEVEKSYSVRLIASDGENEQPQEIQIGVDDINDSPPFFVRARGSVIDETEQVGVQIDYVSAVDSDEVSRRPIRYELYGNDEALNYFAIDDVTGYISNIKVLDYEDPSRTPGKEFTLEVRARELLQEAPQVVLGNDPVTTATAVVTIRLNDINDNCPQFDQPEYPVQIREDITQGVNIPLQMTVTDRDSGSRSTFDLVLFDPSNQFAVTPTSGQSPASVTISVVSAKEIDFETLPNSYTLRVEARENSVASACTGTATVRINVRDVNDESPVFGQQDYSTDVVENAVGGTSLITVTATDRESGDFGQDGIRYSLLGTGQNLFSIDPISGVVTVSSCATPGVRPCIDYETERRYDLAVEARDNAGLAGGLRGSSRLTINVLNVNDNAPTFSLRYRRSIREGEVQTTDPLVIQARDLDNDAITYSIPPGQVDARLWQVNSVTGNVTAIRPIDFRFQALASDGNRNSIPVDIEIRVIDINNKDPIFLPSNYSIDIPENTIGDKSILTVSVTDADSPTTGNGQVDIFIESGNFGKFVARPADTQNGVIRADILTASDATFDYDLQPRYFLLLKAQDRGSPTSRTGTAYVTVNIIDTNNKNPYFDPPTHSVTVSENEPVGYTVTTIPAYDNDADARLSISFLEPLQAFGPSGEERNRNDFDFTNLFRIQPTTGIVQVNAKLDRDQVNLMQIPLLVEDLTVPGQSGTGMLFIRILEYNDQAPFFEQPNYEFEVKEERPRGTFVGSLLAFDEDDAISSYQLTVNPDQLFLISSSSGVLQVNGRLDYEKIQNVTLVARAFDSGSPQLSNTTTIFIRIININDNNPIFQKNAYDINLPEDETSTSPLLQVLATDIDKEDYGVVRYFVNDRYFTIDNVTGEIFYKPGHPRFDREVESTYSFQVTAYDSPNTPQDRRSTSISVYINILDKNDNCPRFLQTNYVGTVIETADIGDQVVELYAEDRDSGENAMLVFSIDSASAQPSDASQLFSVLPTSGRVVVGRSLRNKPGKYQFRVVAKDMKGDNSTGEMCSTSVPVEITVQEAINDAPVWIRPPTSNFSIDVLESQYLGMLVYDCKATDRNPGNAGIIDYSFNVRQDLVQKTPEFRINPVTCIIRAEMVYDREQVESYVVTIVAKDRGDPPASSETVLIIRVLDVNDNDPEFPMRNGETIPYNWNLAENQGPDDIQRSGLPRGVIGQVKATDADTDHENNRIYYKIVAGNDDDLFILDENEGYLLLNPNRADIGLDRESKGVHTMDILAYNDVNDDSVIRSRRRRSTNPSIVTVNVAVDDENDTPPVFSANSYRGCVPINAPFAQSILQVDASDEDLVGSQLLAYSVSTNTDYFDIEPTTGIIRNARLLYELNTASRIQTLSVVASDGEKSSSVGVTIFVTDPDSNEIRLEVSQPSSDVRVYQDQLINVLRNTTSGDDHIVFGCIREIRDHVKDDGTISYTSTDVMMSAIGQRPDGSYFIFSGERLHDILNGQISSDEAGPSYRSLYVKSVQVEEADDDEEFSFTEDPVLAVFIIAILLIFLAIILFILACCLIRSSEEIGCEPPEVMMSVNPVYDNKGFQPDPQPQPPQEDEYAVVNKRRPVPDDREQQPIPVVVPPVVPVVVPAPQDDGPDVYVPEPEVQDYSQEPVIITEPIMDDEKPLMQPPPSDFFQEEPDPVPVIETEVLPDNEYPLPGIALTLK